MKEDIIYDFKSDVLFKFTLANDKDEGSYYLLKLIIEEICDISCHHIVVKNPELNPQVIDEKDMILDIRVEDEAGNIFNVEMQNSRLTVQQYQRFQVYGARILADQEEIGDRYLNVKPVYQIIFIDDIDKENIQFMDTYKSRNSKGWIENRNLITRIYVYLPYINTMKNEKGLDTFNALERAVYIFQNGIDDDIIKLEDKVVKIMKQKAEYFNNNKELRELAFKRSLYQKAIAGEARDKYEEGIEEGTAKGRLENMYQIVEKLFIHSFPTEDTTFLKGLTMVEYESIFDKLLNNSSLEDIKIFNQY